jgi:hypothetical protein
MSCPLINSRRVLVAMSSGKVLPTNMEISPTNRGTCIEQRSCKVRPGELGATSCAAGTCAGQPSCKVTTPVASSVLPVARMLLLPVANPLGVLGISEIVLVLRLGQPGPLELAFPGLTAVGFKAIALALAASTIEQKKFLAVQTLASGCRRLCRFHNQEKPVPENRQCGRKKIQPEEDSEGRRRKKTFQRIF